MKRKSYIRHLLIAVLFMMPSLLWAQGTIQLLSRVELEVIKTNEQGEKVTALIPADKVLPGETVVYTNTVTNTGKEPASDIVINNPVPAHTNYLAASAFGDAEIVFSADNGESFAPEGKVIVVGEDGKPRLASPGEFTNLRWIIKTELQPGASGEVGFRVRLQ